MQLKQLFQELHIQRLTNLKLNLKTCFSKTLIPKFTKNESTIINVDANKINFSELKFKFIISVSSKKFGNVKDQNIIWNKGNKKLTKNKIKQYKVARFFFYSLLSKFSHFFFLKELTEL